jgi:hypothetical protein
MTFLEWVQKYYKPHELTETQWVIVKIVNENLSEGALANLFFGKKACPYRIVQRLWFEYSTNVIKKENGL